jgi:hypothetical protein
LKKDCKMKELWAGMNVSVLRFYIGFAKEYHCVFADTYARLHVSMTMDSRFFVVFARFTTIFSAVITANGIKEERKMRVLFNGKFVLDDSW